MTNDGFIAQVGKQSIDLNKYDNSKIKRAVLDRTTREYQRTLDAYDEFRVNHPTAPSPPDLQSYKGFMEAVCNAMKGRVREDGKPVPDTVDGFRRDFEAAWEKLREYKFPEDVTTTIREFVKSKLGLREGEMERPYLSPDDIMAALVQLWCKDFIDYKGSHRERNRVDLAASILLYCFTSARTGEVHESTARRGIARQKKRLNANVGGSSVTDESPEDLNLSAEILAACYKHFELSIQRVESTVMLVLTYERKYVKGYWRKKNWELPMHSFYEVYKEETPLLVNLLVYFLPMASADNAFRDYGSVDAILDEVDRVVKYEELPGESYGASSEGIGCMSTIRIHFNKDALTKPVFRPYRELSIDCSTGKAKGADNFGKSFANLSRRTGSTQSFNVRGCRRWALNEAASRYSEVARQKFAGQANRDTYGKSYAHPLSEVDGPATFLGIEPREGHIKNLRSMAIHRNPKLWQSLPAKEELKFQQRTDILALEAAIDELGCRIAMAEGKDRKVLHLEQRRLLNKIYQLYTKALREFQKSQPHNLGPSLSTSTYFNYTRRVMPERDVLARLLPMKVELRSPEGREALRALESLCKQDCRVAYRNSLQPVAGKCVQCKQNMDKIQNHRRWLHLYRCYTMQMKLLGGSNFAELCFECDLWFLGKESWNEHCQEHLNHPENLLRYDWIMFRQAPVKAGYCPFCLWDEDLSPAQRMRQHILDRDRTSLLSHVEEHLCETLTCNHPACKTNFESADDLRNHLADVHCWKSSRGHKRKRKDLSPTKGVVQEDIDPRCHLCDVKIDVGLFKHYTSGRSSVPIKEQLELCKAHTAQDAKDEWSQRGYPPIDWASFERRLTKLTPVIRALIRSKAQAFFDTSVEVKLHAGRTLRSSYHSHGYYGPKAAVIIAEHIAFTFVNDLQKAAGDYKGIPAYIQEVLIPEILTIFVAEDMEVGMDEARTILEQSKEIGEILNAE